MLPELCASGASTGSSPQPRAGLLNSGISDLEEFAYSEVVTTAGPPSGCPTMGKGRAFSNSTLKSAARTLGSVAMTLDMTGVLAYCARAHKLFGEPPISSGWDLAERLNASI